MFLKNLAPQHPIKFVRVPSGIPMVDVDGENVPLYKVCQPVTLGQGIWYMRRSA